MGRKSLRMRSEICHFSGLAIYPGHGKTYIKADGKKVILINGKSETLLKNKKNPRKITWTILYRRKHKKGSMTEIKSRKPSETLLLPPPSKRRRKPLTRKRSPAPPPRKLHQKPRSQRTRNKAKVLPRTSR